MRCPSCGKSLWFVRTCCPFCKTAIAAPAQPTAVGIIGLITIIYAGMLLLSTFTQRYIAQDRPQDAFKYAWLCANVVVALITGVFMFGGHNWARWLFALWFGRNIITSIWNGYNTISSNPGSSWKTLVLSMGPPLLGGFLFGAAVYFLFRPAAAAFFSGRSLRKPPKIPPTL
jgi:hypothetical protein